MPNTKLLRGSALACLIAFHMPSSAQPKSASLEAPAADEARSREMNKALLKALLERRAEMERFGNVRAKRVALDFIDSRIAEVRSRIK